jgi:nucleoside-diphosphate-sugar epimerase
MTVLVTGATGFIGHRLVESFLSEGQAVRCLVRRPDKAGDLRRLGADIVAGDLSSSHQLEEAVRDAGAVVHAAGVVHAWSAKAYFETNVEGTRRLAEAAGRAGVKKFVLVSSLAASGPAAGGKDPADPHPINAYGKSKLEGERALKEAAGSMAWCIVRPSAVYGPGDRDFLVLFRLASRGRVPYTGPRGARLSLIHVDDLVDLLRLSLEGPSSAAVYDASDGLEHSWPQIIEAFGSAVGKPARPVRIAPWLLWPVAAAAELLRPFTRRPPLLCLSKLKEARQLLWTSSPAAAREALGWRPRIDLEGGARATAAWYREHGWL